VNRRQEYVVIPGRAKREPGIYNPCGEYGFRACAKTAHPGMTLFKIYAFTALSCSTGLYPAPNARSVDGGVSSIAPSSAFCAWR
jgi:hypothetical protein